MELSRRDYPNLFTKKWNINLKNVNIRCLMNLNLKFPMPARIAGSTCMHARGVTLRVNIFSGLIFMFEKVWTRISILNDKKKALEKGAFWLRGIPSEDKLRILNFYFFCEGLISYKVYYIGRITSFCLVTLYTILYVIFTQKNLSKFPRKFFHSCYWSDWNDVG